VQTVILGSDRFDCLPTLIDRDPGDTPAVYVPTASDVLNDQAYVQQELGRLAGMGFPVTALPLPGTSKQTVSAQLQRARLVFVTGGNAFHLLHHAILSGFTDLVPPLVRSGTLIYAVNTVRVGRHPVEGTGPGHHRGDGTGLLLGARLLRQTGPGGPAPAPASRAAATPDHPDHR
jgi:hypothetical protein